MNNSQVFKLIDLIEDIKKVDAMILLHDNIDTSSFVSSQYESKKTKLMSQLIDQLIAPSVQSPQTLSLIRQVLAKFYPENSANLKYDENIEKLSAAI